MASVISFLRMFIEMGFLPLFLSTWVNAFPMIFVVAYLVVLICFPFILKRTMSICSKE